MLITRFLPAILLTESRIPSVRCRSRRLVPVTRLPARHLTHNNNNRYTCPGRRSISIHSGPRPTHRQVQLDGDGGRSAV